MRDRRRTPAGGVQAEKQQRYVQLIAQGVSNSEACRLVGINRKTGNRWRYGRTVRNSAGALVIYPPVKITEAETAEPAVSLRAGTDPDRRPAGGEDERPRDRREQLGRAPSTISREIRRNSDPDGRYRPHHAEQAAERRACRPRKRRIAGDGVLAEVVQRLLAKRWSPEQVAHELRVLFAGQPSRWLCKESIYQAIYDTAVELTRPARRRRRRRRLQGLQRRGTADGDADDRRAPRRGRGPRPGRSLGGRSDHGRREPLGDRNAGGAHAPGILILLAFPDGIATTDGSARRSRRRSSRLPAGLRRTLTWDQGKELALHQQITAATGTDVFFCDAHSPWQRGSNENMNGLLRDYFPKGTDLERPHRRGPRTDRHRGQRPATQDARLEPPGAAVRERPRGSLTRRRRRPP